MSYRPFLLSFLLTTFPFLPSSQAQVPTDAALIATPSITTFITNATAFAKVVRGDDLHVGVGPGMGISTSVDGVNWNLIASTRGKTLLDVVYGDGRFVAVGGSSLSPLLLVSEDGLNWMRPAIVIGASLRRVAFGNGLFIACGEYDIIWSTNGWDWFLKSYTVAPRPGFSGLRGIEYGAGMFVGVFGSTTVVSRDSLVWNTGFRGLDFVDVAYGNGWFAAVGKDQNGRGVLATSVDGLEWSAVLSLSNLPQRVEWRDPRFIVVGDNGTVTDSGEFAPLAPRILKDPQSIAVGDGAVLKLEALATSHEPISIQWLKDGMPLEGATNLYLLFPDAHPSESGQYQLTASNALGVAQSRVAEVAILSPRHTDHWEVVRRPGTRIRLGRIASRQAFHVATTLEGKLAVCTNGYRWELTPVPTDARLIAVRYLAPWFVAMGERGTLLRSTDGLEWTAMPVPTTNDLRDVARTTRSWVAAGDKGTIIRSFDSNSWELQESPVTNALNRLISIGDEYIAVGDRGTILNSVDGRTWWTEDSSTTADLLGIASNGSTSMAVGRHRTVLEKHFTKWRRDSSIQPLGEIDVEDVAVTGSVFHFVGLGFASRKELKDDGSSFSAGSTVWIPDAYSALSVSEDVVYAVAGTDLVEWSANGGWRSAGEVDHASFRAIADRGDVMIAVGDKGAIVSSNDGAHWTDEHSGTSNSLYSVTVGGNVFVAVGSGGTVLRSENGHAWETITKPTSNTLLSVCYGASGFVAMGDYQTVIQSIDGRDWIPRMAPYLAVPEKIICVNDKYWICGYSRFYSSTDGVSWRASSTKWDYLMDIEKRGGELLALDYSGLRKSLDGDQWSEPPRKDPPFVMEDLALNDSSFVAVGRSNVVAQSVNGVDWYIRKGDHPGKFNDVLATREGFYAVGDFGVIIRTTPPARLRAVRGSTPEIRLEDAADLPYRVEYANQTGDGTEWHPLAGPVKGEIGPVWIDPAATNVTSRIYRAVLE